MQRFSNNRILSIIDLEQSGIYPQELLEDIKHGNYNELERLANEIKADRDYMEPLLYAVKNDFNTYEVYRYYGENLQNDSKLAGEIILLEPELIEGTPISGNKQFIIEHVNSNPEIIQYMSDDLKEDDKIIMQLYNMNNEEITQNIVNSCIMSSAILNNPELANDRDFIGNVIKWDCSLLEFAGEELKNDYDFLKEQSLENEEIIDYVVENMGNFGTEGIKGVRDTSKELTIDDCMNIIDELSQKENGEKYEKLKRKIQDRGVDDVHTIRWVTAMAAQSDDINPQMLKKILNYSILTMEKNRNELLDTKDEQIKLDSMLELISPRVLNKLKDKLEEQGIEIEEELKIKLDDYSKFHEEYHDKFQKQKQKNKEGITVEDINDATKEVKASELKAVIEETEKEIKEDKTNLLDKDIENGENIYER